MQAVKKSLTKAIFKSDMSTLYKVDHHIHCCQLVFFNILKYIFIDNCVMDIIKKYKPFVLNFIPHNSTEDTEDSNLPFILNGCNVNQLFGWAIIKLKAKYLRIKEHLALHKVSIGNLAVLDDMSVKIIDVLNDEHYLNLFYLIDGAVRNEGLLTLCSPHYVKSFSRILTNTRKSITTVNQNDSTIIPNKGGVTRVMIANFDGEFETN